MSSIRLQLLDVARKARQNACAPFSHFQVGAALLSADGRTFTGCNIENCSYGLTVCAERFRRALGNSRTLPSWPTRVIPRRLAALAGKCFGNMAGIWSSFSATWRPRKPCIA